MNYSQFLTKLKTFDIGDRRFDLDNDMLSLKNIHILYDDTLTDTHKICPAIDTLYLKNNLHKFEIIKYKLAAISFVYMKYINDGFYSEGEIAIIVPGLCYLLALLYNQDLYLYQFKNTFINNVDSVDIDSILNDINKIYQLIILDL